MRVFDGLPSQATLAEHARPSGCQPDYVRVLIPDPVNTNSADRPTHNTVADGRLSSETNRREHTRDAARAAGNGFRTRPDTDHLTRDVMATASVPV